MQELATYLNNKSDKLQFIAPKGIEAQKIIDAALVAIHETPKLQDCSSASVYLAVKKAARLGLFPNIMGSCYLVPYTQRGGKPTCELIIGYRGLIDLCRRNGGVKSIYARVVFSDEEFCVNLGTEESIDHTPKFGYQRDKDREVEAVYAIAILEDGTKQFDVMDREEIEAIRESSRGGKFGPWVNNWHEMAKKTVVRRLTKYLPISVDVYAGDIDTPEPINSSPASPVIDVSVDTPAQVKEELLNMLPAYVRRKEDEERTHGPMSTEE